ncbi:MAG: RIP metalloprotease RseP [Ardenticatenaceae bacterium]
MPDLLAPLSSGGVTILSFILVLGLLVFVHELGHFVVAKLAGIRVEEFGFGFPPRMVTLFKKGETEYTINWLPLGGFVRMVGENGEDFQDPRSFASKSRAWRAAVLLAGSAMNLILPIFLFTFMAMAVGVQEGPPTHRVEVLGVEPDSPADEAGLQVGDEILYVGAQRVMDVAQLQALIQRFEGRAVAVDVDRNGEMVGFTMTPRRFGENNQLKIGVLIANQQELVHYNPLRALIFGFRQTGTLTIGIMQGFADLIADLFGGRTESVPVAGPIGIMQVTGEVAQTGQLEYILSFMALLSVNLAIFNLLPIPGLDGGRLLFVGIEALRGQRISAEREGLVHLLGIMLLLALMAFVSVIDIQRLFDGVSVIQ